MGRVFKHDIWYGPAGATRTLHVYLPNGYDESDERYPVMYFFDGHNLFFDEDATYGTCWGLKDFLDQWEKPLIVVGAECSHEGNDRLDEYCPYNGRLLSHSINGKGKATFRWLIDDVKTWADATLRTWPHREATGIGGSSMGGLMSVYGAIAHNDVFSKAACVSPGMRVWGRFLRDELATATLDPDTRLYFSWGEHESGHLRKGASFATESPEARAELDFARRLNEAGIDTYVYAQPDGNHCEADWRKQDGRFLDYLWRNRRWQ